VRDRLFPAKSGHLSRVGEHRFETELRNSNRSRRVAARPLFSRSTSVARYDGFGLETGYSVMQASG
jgi:hypothetical protein